jgi:predicted carbohydrate-binding protein with CBM5 and CBM33 domain
MHSYILLVSALIAQVAAHGYLSSPPPRGIEKAGYQIDDLKSPNRKGLCRGEPEGQITKVKAGQELRLGFTITAPHIGPCRVTLLDADLTNESAPFDEKMNCAAPGGPGFWEIKLPSDVSGHKVLRWYWEGQHISTPGEPYEQCIDLDFGGGSGDAAPTDKKTVKKEAAAPESDAEEKPQPTNKPTKPSNKKAKKPKKTKKPKKAKKSKKKTRRSSKGCKHGAQKCQGSAEIATCNWGKWISTKCGAGTACQSTGKNTVTCGQDKEDN